jgi:hypothetical protein
MMYIDHILISLRTVQTTCPTLYSRSARGARVTSAGCPRIAAQGPRNVRGGCPKSTLDILFVQRGQRGPPVIPRTWPMVGVCLSSVTNWCIYCKSDSHTLTDMCSTCMYCTCVLYID